MTHPLLSPLPQHLLSSAVSRRGSLPASSARSKSSVAPPVAQAAAAVRAGEALRRSPPVRPQISHWHPGVKSSTLLPRSFTFKSPVNFPSLILLHFFFFRFFPFLFFSFFVFNSVFFRGVSTSSTLKWNPRSSPERGCPHFEVRAFHHRDSS